MTIGPRNDAFRELGHGLVDIPGQFLFRVLAILASAMSILRAMLDPAVRSAAQHANEDHPNNPLTPAEAAVAVVKGAVDRGPAVGEAAINGISPERFDVMVELTGNPPGPETLISAWRRGWIGEDRLDRGLRQGILKNEWIPFYKRMRHLPLSAETYVRGAVEGDIDKAEAFRRADEEGMSAEDADLLYRIMGNPPGIVQVLHLWKRGKITEQQVDDVIRDSHYKNRYIDMIKMYAEYFPPPRTVTAMLKDGALTTEQADYYFRSAGLSPELAQAYVASALHTRTVSHKELTVSQVTALYADHLETREEAVADLARVGYGPDDAALLLDLADRKAEQKLKTEAIAGIRRVYVARRLDRAGAQAELSKFEVAPAQQAALLELWDIQRIAPSETLTLGQLNAALKKEVITKEDYSGRVIDLGYTAGDADILLRTQLA